MEQATTIGLDIAKHVFQRANPASATASRRFLPFGCLLVNGPGRPNCDIGHTCPGRPLPDPTADLWTLSVLAKEAGRPWLIDHELSGDGSGDVRA